MGPKVDDTVDALGATAESDAGLAPTGRSGPQRAAPLAPGTKLDRYTIIAAIGAGGMGTVYRARDDELGRDVALKVLDTSNIGAEDARQRLRREAQAMARVEHSAVVRIYDVGTADNHLYVTMELVTGGTLATWIAARPRTWRDVLRTYATAGQGLSAAHAAGIVHRDFKPANVLVDKTGAVRVTDFGLARAMSTEATERPSSPAIAARRSNPAIVSAFAIDLTRTGALLGTPLYMAPEQLRGETADARSDQFAFCLSLWEALYGQRAFGIDPQSDAALMQLLDAAEHGRITPPPRGTRVPRAIEVALRRGLSPDPAQRWASMKELLTALEPSSSRRVAIAASVVAILIAITGVVAWRRHNMKTSFELGPSQLLDAPAPGITESRTTMLPDGSLVRLAASEIRIDSHDGRDVRRVPFPAPGVVHLAPAGNDALAVATEQGERCTWWLVAIGGASARELTSGAAPCFPVDVSRDHTTLIVAHDRTVTVRNIGTSAEHAFEVDAPVVAVALAPDAARIAVTTRENAYVYDRDGHALPNLKLKGGVAWVDASHLLYSPWGGTDHAALRLVSLIDSSDTFVEQTPAPAVSLVTTDHGFLVTMLQHASRVYTVPFAGVTPEITSLAPEDTGAAMDYWIATWSPDGIITSALFHGMMSVLRTPPGGPGTPLASWTANRMGVIDATAGKVIYLLDRDAEFQCELHVLDIASRADKIWKRGGCGDGLGLRAISCAHRARRCLILDVDGNARWLDADTLDLGAPIAGVHVTAYPFVSSDGTSVATIDADHIALTDLASGATQTLTPAPALPGTIRSISWANEPEKLFVVTVDSTQRAHLILLESGHAWRELAAAQGHTLLSATQSPDGASVALIVQTASLTSTYQTFRVRH